MPNDTNVVNALLASLQQQRNDALNKLAHAEARNIVLTAKLAEVQEQAEPPEAE